METLDFEHGRVFFKQFGTERVKYSSHYLALSQVGRTIPSRTGIIPRKRSQITEKIVEDSGAEVERRPLVSKVPGLSPVMSGS